jgi:MFS family permease
VVMKAKVFPSTKRPLYDTKVLRHISYDLFSIGAFFGYMGMYIPFYYISSYSISEGIVDENLGFYILTIINGGSVFGRLIPNFYGDLTGPLNISAPFILLCGVISFCWTTVHNVPSLILFCIFYGFSSGTFVSMTGPCLATLSPEMSLVGTHMGMSFGFGAFGLLIGNPVAGVLLDSGWVGPAVFCGSCNMIAGICIIAARFNKTGLKFRVKA